MKSTASALAALLSLLQAPALLQGVEPEVQTAAYPGTPLGVARVRFTVPDPSGIVPGKERFNLAGEHSRILYPVFLPDPVPSGPEGPSGSSRGFEVLFLFPGAEPVALIATTSLSASPHREFHAAVQPLPGAPEEARRKEIQRWWEAYREVLKGASSRDEHYPIIENYLAWHLPRLLGLPAARAAAEPSVPSLLGAFPEAGRLVDLFLGTESIRIAIQRETLLGKESDGNAPPSLPLPPPPQIRPVELPTPAVDVAIEPIARCVDAECLYVWFPRFADFSTFKDKAETWLGSLNDLVLGRSFDGAARETLETQLALRETVVSRLFGDLAIGEMAIVAYDTFVREGSALGIIFDVRNETLFNGSVGKQREEAIEASLKWPEGPASERTLEIAGRPVKLLEAPGNRIRSFHVSAGRFHLITNCRRLAERFLECSQGGPESLADDPGFRHARWLHPQTLPQSALVFMSDPFLRRLIGPACRAEMTRRMGARSALEAAETARRVASAETGRTFDLQGLVEAGYLSDRILRRSDGSELLQTPGGFTDSLRGRRGTFLPIPDVGVEKLTVAEARAYDSFSTFYRRQWERVDPAVIRIVLVPGTKAPAPPPAGAPPAVPTAGAASGDRVDLVVDILPFAREPYQLLRAALAPSAGQSLEPLPDEIFSVEGRLGLMLAPKPFLMRVGLLDFDRSIILDQTEGRFLSDLWILPVYAILPVTERFPDGTLSTLLLGGKPGPDGFIRLEGGLIDAPMWGKECPQGLVVSPRKEIAERVAGAIRAQEQSPAQVRLRIDLGDSRRITPSVRANAYQRTLQASEAGASLLSVLHGVLKVPLAECETEAQRILAARVVCPAGGKFIANPYPSAGGPFFTSDAFPPEGRSESEKIRRAMAYRSSALEWLRALKISFRLDGRALHSEATIILPPASME